MSDNDLERQLRSEHGPREEGYTPTRLPMSLEEARSGARSSGPAPLVRGGLFVGAAVAGVLAVAVAAVVLSGPRDGGIGSGSPAASPSAAPSGSAGACAPADVTFTAEPWGASAGSRGTTVTLTIVAGRPACEVPSEVAAQIADADGKILVSREATSTGTLKLADGSAYQVGIAWSNWCDTQPAPAPPVVLSLRFSGWNAWAPITIPAGGDDPVPPCNGESGTSLSVTGLQPAQ